MPGVPKHKALFTSSSHSWCKEGVIWYSPMCNHAGMQVLAGDIDLAEETFGAFFSLWQRFGLLPERFTLDMGLGGAIHPTEQYYPLRPELIESAFYLHEVCTSCEAPPSAQILWGLLLIVPCTVTKASPV